MTEEQVTRGRELLEAIKATQSSIMILENDCDISIEGNYKRESDNPLWIELRDTALKFYRARLGNLKSEFKLL